MLALRLESALSDMVTGGRAWWGQSGRSEDKSRGRNWGSLALEGSSWETGENLQQSLHRGTQQLPLLPRLRAFLEPRPGLSRRAAKEFRHLDLFCACLNISTIKCLFFEGQL